MRLSTDDDRDEELAVETIAAAVKAGVTVFDTAHAYARAGEELGHNEALLARALRRCGGGEGVRIVTKGGMTRVDGRWIPDGRASSIRRDCEASLAALDGLPIDLYLIHAPDPRTPWRTTVRALARLLDDAVVQRVGLSNVNRSQLDEALELVPVTAVQIALSLYDDGPIRGGLIEHCARQGVAVIAHSPLGGPRRAGSLARNTALVDVANQTSAIPAEVALAWILALSPTVVAIPGARRPQTARSLGRAARLSLDADQRAVLTRAFGRPRAARVAPTRLRDDADVVLVMGIPGAGKTGAAEGYVARGYLRLNRDSRGGSLRELAESLDTALSEGVRRVVLDNTWLTRVARSHVIDAAARHRVPIRCVWIETQLAQAQVNLIGRVLDRFGSLPAPDALKELARRQPGVLTPTSQMRTLRELEPPSTDEGLASVERVPFVRRPTAGHTAAGVFVAATALRRPGWAHALEEGDRGAPHLVFDWSPDGQMGALDACVALLRTTVHGTIESALCPHAAGPPVCWCRPPLPGLPLAFARAHRI
ncbi:MAG TPA: aldo/keto reductase, partial [Solirubrobacteraceae bacterium]